MGKGDFPGGPVVKNLPSNAGDAGLIPGWGSKIPRAAGQLSPHATTRENAMNAMQSLSTATKTRHSQKKAKIH